MSALKRENKQKKIRKKLTTSVLVLGHALVEIAGNGLRALRGAATAGSRRRLFGGGGAATTERELED